MKKRDAGMTTSNIHTEDFRDGHGSPHAPLYDTTTFGFGSTEELLAVVDGYKDGFLYTRYGMNPTIRNLEAKLARLDGAESALAFSSGMAALSALFLAHGRRGIVCIGDAYGGTLELLSSQLPGLGIATRQLLLNEIDTLESVLKEGVGLVFFETPTNPRLELVDIVEVAKLAHAHGALVAVDNTFATPVNQRPLALGADLAMQSATKYLGGHSDLTAGVLCGSRELLKAVVPWRKNLGQTIAPEIAHKLSRSLATLVLRVEKHNSNAMAVADFLEAHPKVERVYYPGLRNCALALAQMSGFGGMVTFDIKGSPEQATRFIDSLQLISLAPSLGGVESLATQPVTTSHRDMAEDERVRRGIGPTMIRLSVGLEDERDLIEDLDQALAKF
jgi:cystathionine gamma-synthase